MKVAAILLLRLLRRGHLLVIIEIYYNYLGDYHKSCAVIGQKNTS